MANQVKQARTSSPSPPPPLIDYKAYLQLSRVQNRAGVLLIFWPFAWSLVMSARTLNLPLNVVTQYLGWGLVGSFLFHSAGCIWDDIVDRNLDAQVERTKNRPLPSGRVSVPGALVWLAINVIPLLALLWPSNHLAWTIGLISIFPLAGLYPFMKRVTYWPQAWLGLALNTGAIAAWAYTSGTYPLSALVLSAGAWAWTLWYDTIYACQDRKDDLKAGIKSTAVLFASRTKLILSFFALIILSSLFISGVLNSQGEVFYVVSVGGAAVDLVLQLMAIDLEHTESCGKTFHRNGYTLGTIVFTGIMLDYILTCLL